MDFEHSSSLIGVVSDSHGHVGLTHEAVRMLEEFELLLVIHCGDIGSPEVVRLFSQWPTHYVFGNVDFGFESGLEAAIQAEGERCHGRFGTLDVAGKSIAFLHGDDVTRLRETTNSGEYDLVCYGHTHIAAEEQVGSTLLLNPGAIFRANPHSVCLVDLETMEVTRLVF